MQFIAIRHTSNCISSFRKSLLISEVSKIAKEAEKKDIYSEPFTHNGETYEIFVEFKKEDDEMFIGPYVSLLSDPPK